MGNNNLNKLLMDIRLNDSDISQMPELLRTSFLDWLPQYLKTNTLQPEVPVSQQSSKPETPPTQLTLDLALASQTSDEKSDNSHVKLTQLFDAGMTKQGMPVRVKLKQDVAKNLGREYINNNLEISIKGTIVYDGQDFDKPSPLAKKLNGSSANGWESIEVKKNNKWICLNELRATWRKTND
ncbi:MAG: hypothetical protein JGK10_18690 [Microcoleus sp. PH2017_13_LAR_U_A]|jgi:hypothetical protein|nr:MULTISPECIES: hypothetical protein [unclassified Microcoleus]MCC3473763.1 hypothetical protein [Microcoleus sp. PH2017_13_LAR_U_A]